MPAMWRNVPLPYEAPVTTVHLDQAAVITAGSDKVLLIPNYGATSSRPNGYALRPVPPGIKDDKTGYQIAAVSSALQKINYDNAVPDKTVYIRQSETHSLVPSIAGKLVTQDEIAIKPEIEIDVSQAGLRIVNKSPIIMPRLSLLGRDQFKVMPDMRAGVDDRDAVYAALLMLEPELDNEDKLAPVRVAELYPCEDNDSSRTLQLLVGRMGPDFYPHLQPLPGYRTREYLVDPQVRTMYATDYMADDGRPEIASALTSIQAWDVIAFAHDITDGSVTLPK